jgi:hypothetical protein
MTARRFPPPWSVEGIRAAFVVKDITQFIDRAAQSKLSAVTTIKAPGFTDESAAGFSEPSR